MRHFIFLVVTLSSFAFAPPRSSEVDIADARVAYEVNVESGRCGQDSLRGGIVVDDADSERVEITAYWKRLTARQAQRVHGPTVLSDGGYAADAVVRFRPELPTSGTYAVYLYWPSLPDEPLATNASVSVRHAGGSKALTVNQRANPGAWNVLGTFRFDADQEAYVEIRNDAADGVVLADAAAFRLLTDTELCDPPQPDTAVVNVD